MLDVSTAANVSSDIEYLMKLINFPSVSPSSAGCMEWLSTKLQTLGFTCEVFKVEDTTNMIAELDLGDGPIFSFAGHIDVVPANQIGWNSKPFEAQIINNHIVGRGAADMKGAIAAMLAACQNILLNKEFLSGKLIWLITSDEEGDAEFGTSEIVKLLKRRNVKIDYCLLGEPTCDKLIGDTIKNGRRGSISAKLIIDGVKGHVAYPEKCVNAAHVSIECARKLVDIDWSFKGQKTNTNLQITNLFVPNAVDNVVPGQCYIEFNIRYSSEFNSCSVKEKVINILKHLEQNCSIKWQRACEPYYNELSKNHKHTLLNSLQQAVYKNVGIETKLSTSGGTSDGRFISDICEQVLEFGLRNYCIHQVNEEVSIVDLNILTTIYSDTIYSVLAK